MSRELTRSLGEASLRVRLWTLKDKDSLFRAKNPDIHIVELVAETPGSDTEPARRNIVMTKEYTNYVLAKSHYNAFLMAFGKPKKLGERKKSS